MLAGSYSILVSRL